MRCDWMQKYDIQVWVRSPLLWWKPSWPGSNRVCTSQRRFVEVQHILIKSDYRGPQRKRCRGSKHWKRQGKEFQKAQASINQQPDIKREKKGVLHEFRLIKGLVQRVLKCLNEKKERNHSIHFNLHLLHVYRVSASGPVQIAKDY